jgi:soluble lytic murein transglycosylase-like protein
MLSIIYVESKGKANAIGDSGKARGLTQIWTTTAQEYGPVSAEELLDPKINIEYGFKHFEKLLESYKGNIALALYAWNRGKGKVDKLISYDMSPQNSYALKVYEGAS